MIGTSGDNRENNRKKKSEVTSKIDEEDVLISVLDEGPGVAERYKDSIFERFIKDFVESTGGTSEHRASSHSELRGGGSKGSGLGLAIAKKIVMMLGGTIGVEDRIDSSG